jgi:hypothetical protein
MTDEPSVYYAYQADGYHTHHPALICAYTEGEAIDHHKQLWREMFDKPADTDPHDETYARELELPPGDSEPGVIEEL